MDRIINNRHHLPTIPISTTRLFGTLALASIIAINAIGQKAIAQASTTPATSPEVSSLQTKLTGQWQAKNPKTGEVLTLVFTQNSKLLIQLPSGSEKPTAQEFEYRINPTPQPMQLDVIFPGTDQFVPTIFELTPTGELRLQLVGTSPGKPRPTVFSPDAALFQKVSQATTLASDVQVLTVPILIERERQNEGKRNLGTMNRAQQAYYLEYNKFAKTISELGINIKPETENYRYQIVSQDDSNRVMIMATAKRPELKSYTGVVFIVKDNQKTLTITGICETDKASSTPPGMPKAPSNLQEKIECPVGSNRVER